MVHLHVDGMIFDVGGGRIVFALWMKIVSPGPRRFRSHLYEWYVAN